MSERGATTLPTHQLGRSDLHITRVGLGAWAMGGGGWVFGWGGQDDDESIAAIRRALELGVNWIDTAAVYGFGHSEEVIGRLLRELPEDERPYVFTKWGVRQDPAGKMLPTQRVGDPAFLREELEASLSRLGVDQIDLYQVHWPAEDGTSLEEYWGAMLEMQQKGLVRHIGLSNHGVDLLERAEALGHVDSLQPPLSLLKRDAALEIAPWCADHGTGVIVYSPMQAGLLTGAFSADRVAALPEDDWRRASPLFNGAALEANLALVDAMRPIAARHGCSLGAVAIAWTLSVRGVTGAIVGARRPSQVDGWIAAATLELDEQDLAALTTALRETGAGSGPIG
ncbi:MAG: aldo/keto reductase [Actinomycetota bacterium]|jgi:aryl-alcohol dehydrogenase-like predicted oxidoreductase|nr:aldo/keto reductase [Actinomycetota bacterium]